SREQVRSRLEKVLPQLPYSELVMIATNGKLAVTEIPSARDRIVFNQDSVRIAFLDGLHRRPESPTIHAGRFSPAVSHVVSTLSRGVPRSRSHAFLGSAGWVLHWRLRVSANLN